MSIIRDSIENSRQLQTEDYSDNTVLTKVKNVDGSGSGLDADTVDGYSSTYFQPVSIDVSNFANNLSSSDDTVQKALDTIDDLVLGGTTGSNTSPGYVTLDNGLIIQWGVFDTTGTNNTITFPIAFPNSCLAVNTCIHRDYDGALTYIAHVRYFSSTSFLGRVYTADYDIGWIAMGY